MEEVYTNIIYSHSFNFVFELEEYLHGLCLFFLSYYKKENDFDSLRIR